MDGRPGAHEHRQPFARLVPAYEHDPRQPAVETHRSRQPYAVGDDHVLARRVVAGRFGRSLGDGDTDIDALEQEAPQRCSQSAPARRARRVKGRHNWARRGCERGDGEGRCQRLVHVHEVERFAGKNPPQPHHRRRTEHDVRERVICGRHHRTSKRDHIVRGPLESASGGMEEWGQPPGWVVTNQDPRLHPELAERSRLLFRMLDHAAPERKAVWDDNPDFHVTTTHTLRQCTMT